MFSRAILYPPDFVERVVAAMPDDPEIRELLESGSGFSVETRLERNNKAELLGEWKQIFSDRPQVPMMDFMEL